MDFAYKWSQMPICGECFGTKLKPYCLGHSYLLEVYENALVTKEKTITKEEIYFAYWVLSRTYEEAKEGLTNQQYILDKFGQDDKFWEFDAEQTMDCLVAHMQWFSKGPRRKADTKGEDLQIPWQLFVATNLIKNMNISEQRAWNMSLSEALCYNSGVLYINGDRSFLSDSQVELEEKIKAKKEELERNGFFKMEAELKAKWKKEGKANPAGKWDKKFNDGTK